MLKESYYDMVENEGIVLILILMEHAQRVCIKGTKSPKITCLNPYFNGTCSKSNHWCKYSLLAYVLILILMEHAQRDYIHYNHGVNDAVVLILILMEHAQRAIHFNE